MGKPVENEREGQRLIWGFVTGLYTVGCPAIAESER